MAFADWPYVAKAAVLLTGVFIAYQGFLQLTVGRKRRALQREMGTMPPRAFPTRDPIMGFDKFRENMKALKEHRLLEMVVERFRLMNTNTFTIINLGKRVVITACLLYTSPSPRDGLLSRMPSSA